ncbi:MULTISPECIES: mannonate dehydratase [Thalassospira]|jgi:mannonate dehydratase|uniref:Mannonate dehydratase n=1 Tax=Thalassospira xiamenensis TaxID=220697 RepID=A0ABR5Y5B5_9PROT|nr:MULTISPECIES: mannonate dehydratase [Thalassospira]MBR9780466.1 mannonate dehydratase [Rhodospirillales bacterium]KZD04753.1 mannonate dehydratase [Thalassospira xiamenensis]KZD05527.1 mannonate dehydratase [Thalassospira xiamenensis]MAB34623.1 mannonate dehydratase [Thalassospira sp.]MBA05238.1 mannonate dehydratase [Thalassospira sp.]|tara:strand:+ start:1119 stop:2342 length:1224 start_codon:yes stop_codon:yes gene_type:complete
MKQTWRWFGPSDLVSIDDICQAGAHGVVSALHHVPSGAVWTSDEIARRHAEIATMKDGAPSGLTWDVVESLPVSESIKRQVGPWRNHIEAYKQSLRNLADSGIRIVCYNFMPVLDWTRTHLNWRLANGATCMRFDLTDFVAFDLFILNRAGAENDYPAGIVAEAKNRFAEMTDKRRAELERTVAFGLPGSVENLSLDDLRALLETYAAIDADTLRANLVAFLEEVVPVAREVGIRMCCHPDDPPFALLGLPRIMSTEDDYAFIMRAIDIAENGITLCSGSLGVRPENDLPGMMRRWGDRVHFIHLRNTKRESEGLPCSFHEAEHLDGDTNMVDLIEEILREEARRKAAGRADWNIPMRPDHGQDILDDLNRKGQPGYPAIGRLKGLAELRGVMTALSARFDLLGAQK